VSAGDAVFRRIQSVARSAAAKSGTGAPTQEYLIERLRPLAAQRCHILGETSSALLGGAMVRTVIAGSLAAMSLMFAPAAVAGPTGSLYTEHSLRRNY
jgi:hypothetical protein